MKSFTNFINDEYLALETILYHDAHLFKNICEGKYELSEDELKKYEIEHNLINEDSDDENEKKYLQNDEEIELIKTYKADPDSQEGRDAMEKLVENKMGYIYSRVNKFIMAHPELNKNRDDLVQEASLALVKAIEKFDPEKNAIFNAYATKCIAGAIRNAFNPVRKKSDTMLKEGEKESLDLQVSGDRGQWADKDQSLMDLTPDENAKEPWEMLDDEDSENRTILKMILKELPERERKAIELYFPKDGKKASLEEIGKELHMTKMGAKKLIDRVLTNLKTRAEAFKQYI